MVISSMLREPMQKLPISSRKRRSGLDPELVYGDEMESLPKKSWSPGRRAEMITLIKEVIKHQGDKALPSFLYVPDLFCAPIFTLMSFHTSQSTLVCLLRHFLT